MTESSDTSDTLAKPQDYAGLRAELASLVEDFTPVVNQLWLRLETTSTGGNYKARAVGGDDKVVVSGIINLLIEALKGIGATDYTLLQAHTKADHHNPSSPTPPDQAPLIPQCLTSQSTD